MKILLDHNTPQGLRHLLAGHEVETAQYRGWDTLRNGDLLQNALDHGFELVITCDQGIRFEQNLPAVPIPVLTIATNHWPTIRASIPLIKDAIPSARAGQSNTLRLRQHPLP